jgi:hypothetical protein
MVSQLVNHGGGLDERTLSRRVPSVADRAGER